MDVSMPEIDGFELAEIIRQHPRFQKTAIIFVSAVHLTDLDRLKGYQHGAVDYLSVPIVPEVLRAKVRVFAELHRKKLQLERLNNELEQRVADRTLELEQKAGALQQLEQRPRPEKPGTGRHCAHRARYYFQPASRRDQRLHQQPILRIHRRAARDRGLDFGWLEYLHPEDKERSLAEWLMRASNRESYESEYRIRGIDRAIPLVPRSRRPASRDPEGNILKWYGTCSDIHDSKMLEQSIRDSAIELERMVDRAGPYRTEAPVQPPDDDAGRRTPPDRPRNSRRPGTRVGCSQNDSGWNSLERYVAFDAAGLRRRQPVSGSRHPASPNHFPSLASSSVGRGRAGFRASLVSGRFVGTQRNRYSAWKSILPI